MWFGDLVTMRWWDDLWLNESFAEWASHHAMVQATAYDEGWTGFTNNRKNWAYRQDQLDTTHPIAADSDDLAAVEVNFDGITYAKGASALKQLVAWVGEGEFMAGLRAYFARHAFANSEFSDLLTALEETSGRDLRSWAEEWLQTSGVNTLAPRVRPRPERRLLVVPGPADGRPGLPTLRRHRIGIGLYDRDADGHLVLRTTVETDVLGEQHRHPEAGRSGPARPAAAQRRRPVLRQDPLRRTVARDGPRLDPHPRRLPGAGAVLGRSVGHDPRGAGARRRLRDDRAPGAGVGDRRDSGEDAAAVRPAHHRPVRAPLPP